MRSPSSRSTLGVCEDFEGTRNAKITLPGNFVLGIVYAEGKYTMKSMIITLAILLLAGCVCCSLGATHINRATVPTIDLNRFLGHWYEIARYNHRFERNLDAVETDYTMLRNGKIEVLNRGVDRRTGKVQVARGKAHTTHDPGRLRVSFFLFFYSDYNILEVDEDYEWALIGSRSPRYLWILARRPELSPETLDYILRLAHQRGYNTSSLIYPAQPAADQATDTAMPSASM